MKEFIGNCSCCNKEIFCLDGFFNGILTETKEIYCFDCHETLKKKEENPQG
ncbi:hypothetical protein [Neobacillus sp. Marseille-QA0830]